MSKIVNVDDFNRHMDNLMMKATNKGDASSAVAFKALKELFAIYADIYGVEQED